MANDIAHNGNSTIELILMDCDMPVMDGFTCVNHIVNFKIQNAKIKAQELNLNEDEEIAKIKLPLLVAVSGDISI